MKNRCRNFIVLLLCSDLIFIIIHIIEKIVFNIDGSLYNISTDRGYAEFYQYMKYFWIIILLIYIIRSTKSFSYISWIVVFTYFLFDDALEIHENVGRLLVKSFDFYPPLHIRLQDIGELEVFAIVGIILLAIIIWAKFHGSISFKKRSIDLGIFMVGFVFFGVFFDMLSSIFNGVVVGLGMIEDGGEMIVMSLTLWYVFQASLSNENSELFLHEHLQIILKKVNNQLFYKDNLTN